MPLRTAVYIPTAADSPAGQAIPGLAFVAAILAAGTGVELPQSRRDADRDAKDMRAILNEVNRMPETLGPGIANLEINLAVGQQKCQKPNTIGTHLVLQFVGQCRVSLLVHR